MVSIETFGFSVKRVNHYRTNANIQLRDNSVEPHREVNRRQPFFRAMKHLPGERV